MLTLTVATLFLVGLLNILIGLLVLFRDPWQIRNRLFFLFSLSLGGWVIGIGGFLLSEAPGTAFIWAKVYYSFPLFIAATMPLFAQTFPKRERIPNWLWVSSLAGLLILFIPLVTVPGFLTADLAYHEWGKEIILNKQHYLLYSVYLLSFFVIGLNHIYRKSSRLAGLERLQAKMFFWGFILTSSLGVLFNLILPWFGNYRLIWLGPLFTNAFILATGYSIIKHKMFDIRFYVLRALAYLMTLVFVSLLYLAPAILFILYMLDSRRTPLEFAFILSVALALSMGYNRLLRILNVLTKTVFFRNEYNPELFIAELNRTVVSTLDMDKLLSKAAKVIESNFKADYCMFILDGKGASGQRYAGTTSKSVLKRDKEFIEATMTEMGVKIILTNYLTEEYNQLQQVLNKYDIALLARLITDETSEQEGLGYIVLGAKKSGQQYNSQDIRTLETIIDSLIIAIQNAMRFEEIRNFNLTLQRTVEEKTRELRKVNAKLVMLDETKDDFISMASHQLRTPLTSVKGYISMVLEEDAGPLTNMQRKMLNQSYLSAQRMVYLIADLLNVSRLKTGKFVVEPSRLQLQTIVQDQVDQLMETAKGRNLTLTFEKPDHFPDLVLDETKIHQVIMNFIDNAIYYTKAGGHITVKLSETPDTIEFKVIDNGIGVPKHEQPHLFTKFYRAGNARRARPDGTGLGLFMAKKVIAAQGGSIIFQSTEGKGSTFGFIFPKSKVLARPLTTAKSA